MSLCHDCTFPYCRGTEECSQCTQQKVDAVAWFKLTDEDIGVLQSAVENLRSAPEGEDQRKRILDARWSLAYKIEQMAIRVVAAQCAGKL